MTKRERNAYKRGYEAGYAEGFLHGEIKYISKELKELNKAIKKTK